jgi:hypothetical protein
MIRKTAYLIAASSVLLASGIESGSNMGENYKLQMSIPIPLSFMNILIVC